MEDLALDNVLQVVIQAVVLADDDADSDDNYDDDDDRNDRSDFTINVEWWRRMGDPTFRKHFRMERYIFESLLLAVGRHMERTNRLTHRRFPLDIALMMTLWVLATPDSFRSVGVTFHKLEGSVHRQYVNIIGVLREMSASYVCWPSGNERNRIARNFEHMFGYPGVSGCIDGTHIAITAPLEQPERYFNYHHDYSIIVQAVCDHRLLFRDAFIGQPGAVGDRRTFERSALGRAMYADPQVMGPELHLLGDGAYMLTDKLLIPYRNYGNLTQQQRHHNYILSRCRSSIERAFALLKGKWRRLKYFPTYCLEYCMDHIMACIVLHNFMILEGEAYEEEYVINEVQEGNHDDRVAEAQRNGVLKRDYIAAMLMQDNEEAEENEEAVDDPEAEENEEAVDDPGY